MRAEKRLRKNLLVRRASIKARLDECQKDRAGLCTICLDSKRIMSDIDVLLSDIDIDKQEFLGMIARIACRIERLTKNHQEHDFESD